MLAARLLGRQVLGGADDRAGLRHLRVTGARDAEVGHLHAAVAQHHHVVRLDVAVDDLAPVREPQRGEQLQRDVDRAALRQRALAEDHVLQRLAVQVLHRDVVRALGLAAVVDGDDVRVVQPGGGARLACEPLDELRVLVVAIVQDLDRDLAVQVDVLGEEDARHAPRADAADDAVPAVEQPTVDRGLVSGPHRAAPDCSTRCPVITAIPSQQLVRGRRGRRVPRPFRRSRWSPRSTTAIATFGDDTGANATNQASDSGRPVESLRPVCAVPVLPATWRSPICAAWPVPSSTTRCMMPASVEAVCGETGRPISSAAERLRSTRPDGLRDLVDHARLHHHAVVRDRRRHERHLQRRREQAGLADRDARHVDLAVGARRAGPAACRCRSSPSARAGSRSGSARRSRTPASARSGASWPSFWPTCANVVL